MKTNILDCTLRDGGYINSWEFDDEHIKQIITKLNEANIDIVECGFLDQKNGKGKDYTRFSDIKILNALLMGIKQKATLHVAMIDHNTYDVSSLPKAEKSNPYEIKGIRYTFRKSDCNDIFDNIKIIIEKGYKLFLQPMATKLYSDAELVEFIQKCNTYDMEAFYIVDTHGSMLRDDFRRLYYLIDHNLKQGVKLGFHSHNNLQLSYSLAMDFMQIANKSEREIICDSSIYGMGRGAGNLNTELLADYINRYEKGRYAIDPLLEVIDSYLLAIKQNHSWGYSLEYFLSATHNCHPNYASFLINTKNLSIVEVKKLLAQIAHESRREFDKSLIQKLYINYKQSIKLAIKNLPQEFFAKDTLMLAAGKSVSDSHESIKAKVSQKDLQVIAVNHISSYIKSEFVFFANQARYDEFADKITSEKLIVTSNIKIKSSHNDCYCLDYKALYEYEDLQVDNTSILLLNLFAQQKVKNIFIAGLDGYELDNLSQYSYKQYNIATDKQTLQKTNEDLIKAIKHLSQKIHITYLSASMLKQYTKQKIVGVIPSRFNSTRLPGKPLLDICGLPMVIHVLKRALMCSILDEVVVATDDKRIYDEVVKYGGKAVMTDEKHDNGSERLCEVAKKIDADVFCLINGDEALLNPIHIKNGVEALLYSHNPVSVLYNDYDKFNSPSDFKVVLNKKHEIMYISRNDMPSNSRNKVENMYKAYHVMSFTNEFLAIYENLEQTYLDKIESHELLRVLENGYKIQGAKVESSAISVDTKEDLEWVREKMKNDELFLEYGKL